jgi:meiotically up-regulated gene 157 (Mug157) protein
MRALAVALAGASVASARRPVSYTAPPLRDGSCTMPDARPAPGDRLFVSPAIEAAISTLLPKFKDPNLGRLFANALPNSLDTTVYRHTATGAPNGGPDTFMITGDIDASWLRDSTNQVLPYLRFVAQDPALQTLVAGVIGRHARSILLDPYANAFQVDSTAGQGPHSDDSTSRPAFAGTTIDAMTPAIFERKWELDSLANPMRLAALYYNATHDLKPFDAEWVAAMTLALDTMKAQQLSTEEEDDNGGPPYVFQRNTGEPTDTLEHGRGPVGRHTGMIKCGFRGSDDALTLPFNIPENAFAASSLRLVSDVFAAVNATALQSRALLLASEIEAGIQAYGVFTHPTAGQIYAYEVDGFGNSYFMDDANIPGLISMPLYGFAPSSDPLYAATRAAVLSEANPYFMCGSAGCGVGGPHNGYYWIWPMAIAARAYTSTDDGEIAYSLAQLVNSSACTGLVHESFDRNSFGTYTRPWFAWMNSLFADLVLKVADERPYLIF